MTNQAPISRFFSQPKSSVATTLAQEFAALLAGVLLLALTAQLVIPLWWTPVPLTGQSFGVLLLALVWGRHRGVSVVSSYVALGFLGAPIFAAGAALPTAFGPTSGYLVGMVVAAFLVGWLSDRGWVGSYVRAFGAAIFGTLIVLFAGVVGLMGWPLPAEESIWTAGFLPFVPGGIVKSAAAALIAAQVSKSLAKGHKKVITYDV